MPVDDMLDDGQTKTGATNLPGSRLVDTVETFGQAVQMPAGNLLARIGNANHHMTILRLADTDDHIGICIAIFHRVLDQVVKHLIDLVSLAIHDKPRCVMRAAVIQNNTHVVLVGARFQAGNDRAHNLHQRHPCIGDDMLIHLNTGQ